MSFSGWWQCCWRCLCGRTKLLMAMTGSIRNIALVSVRTWVSSSRCGLLAWHCIWWFPSFCKHSRRLCSGFQQCSEAYGTVRRAQKHTHFTPQHEKRWRLQILYEHSPREGSDTRRDHNLVDSGFPFDKLLTTKWNSVSKRCVAVPLWFKIMWSNLVW